MVSEMADRPGAIVIGGHTQGLGLIRSFAKAGIPVCLIDDKRAGVARFSKYCKAFFYFAAVNDEEKFVKYLIELAETANLKNWLLMPTSDGVVATLSRNKTQLDKHFLVPVPEWDIVKYAYDKKLTYKLATKEGILIPKTLYPDDEQDVRRCSEEMTFPVIIKPAIMHMFYEKTKSKVIFVPTPDKLLSSYAEACRIVPPSELLIQEVIPGSAKNLYSFCSFFKQGTVMASCMGRRARQIPMDFGKASTFVETVNIAELELVSIKLLKAVGYYGLSEVEFKLDSRDGQFKLLEINPRTWKWHTLALHCGINLPYLLYQDMHGDLAGEITLKSKEGVKWIDFYTDTYVSAREIVTGHMTLRQYFSSIKGDKEFAVASWNDPLPFIAETFLAPVLFMTR